MLKPSFIAFLRWLARSWVRSATTRTWTGTHMTCWCCRQQLYLQHHNTGCQTSNLLPSILMWHNSLPSSLFLAFSLPLLHPFPKPHGNFFPLTHCFWIPSWTAAVASGLLSSLCDGNHLLTLVPVLLQRILLSSQRPVFIYTGYGNDIFCMCLCNQQPA